MAETYPLADVVRACARAKAGLVRFPPVILP